VFDCDDILSMTNKHFVASGWTKAVYRGDLKNQSYAIKTVSPQGTDISSCLDRGHRYDVCYNEAAKKIIKETYHHNQTRHCLWLCEVRIRYLPNQTLYHAIVLSIFEVYFQKHYIY
jgi:hypothetical protein